MWKKNELLINKPNSKHGLGLLSNVLEVDGSYFKYLKK